MFIKIHTKKSYIQAKYCLFFVPIEYRFFIGQS
jgi:hypothetical protein